MSTKRSLEESDESGLQYQSNKKARKNKCNEYRGFSLQYHGDEAAPTIREEDPSISPQDFFYKYVAQRRPCLIKELPKLASSNAPPSVTLEQLIAVAGDERVQVERRCDRSESFGQNRTASRQQVMTVSDFVKRLLEKDGDLYYLSTQDSSDHDHAFHVPCRQLLDKGHISAGVLLAGRLVLQSCTLWVGASQEGSSSGLHHDYHDNFYMLIRGVKKFRLYSPDCAPFMYLHGNIDRVHFNGLISYVGNETRADGISLPTLEDRGCKNGKRASENESGGEDSEEEEGTFFGNGFGDDSDAESNCGFDASHDDFDMMAKEEESKELAASKVETDETGRPNSFSKIEAKILQDAAAIANNFPQFTACRECKVELKEGQLLYLPAGWFHEVTSGTGTEGANHTALNYWYHPPDSVDNFEQPYNDFHFWKEESK